MIFMIYFQRGDYYVDYYLWYDYIFYCISNAK